MIVETQYTFMEKGLSYEILDNGYKIYLGGQLWVTQREPNIPYPCTTYEESCIKHIKELCGITDEGEDILSEDTNEPPIGSYVILKGSTTQSIAFKQDTFILFNSIIKTHKTNDWLEIKSPGRIKFLKYGTYLITGMAQFSSIAQTGMNLKIYAGPDDATSINSNLNIPEFQILETHQFSPYATTDFYFCFSIPSVVVTIDETCDNISLSASIFGGSGTINGDASRLQIVRLSD